MGPYSTSFFGLCKAVSLASRGAADVCTDRLMQIGLERSRLLELEDSANGLQGKIGTQRKAMGGVNAAREANIQVNLTALLHELM